MTSGCKERAGWGFGVSDHQQAFELLSEIWSHHLRMLIIYGTFPRVIVVENIEIICKVSSTGLSHSRLSTNDLFFFF